MIKYISVLASIIVFILVSSCVKNLESPEKISGIERGIGLPLLNSTISFADIKKPNDNTFRIDVGPEGYYVMVVGPLTHDFPEAGTLIDLAKNGIAENNIASIPLVTTSTGSPITNTFPIPLDLAQGDSVLSNTTINQVYLSGGTLDLELESTLPNSTISVSITFPTLVSKTTNQPLKLNYDLINKTIVDKQQDLKNYILKLNGSNSINLTISLSVKSTQNPPVIGDFKINSFKLSNLKWERIDGKFGNIALALGNQQAEVNLLIKPFSSSNNPNDSTTTSDDNVVIVYFQDPSIQIKFLNSFGFKSQLILNPFKSLDKDYKLLRDQTSEIGNVPFIVQKPNDPNISSSGFPSTTVNTITGNLIRELMYKGPKYISYGLILSVTGANSFDNDFILSTSKIQTETEIKLPLYGYLDNFKIEADIDAPDFSQLSNTTSGSNVDLTVNLAVFKFNFENKIPIDIITTLQFLDASNATIPGVGIFVTIPGGQLDAPTIWPVRAPLNKSQFQAIKDNCKKIRLTGSFNTKGVNNPPPTNNVKFYPSNNLKMQMSVFLNANADFTFNE